MADYNALLRMPDPGTAFQTGFQASQQMRQQAQAQNALLQRQALMDQRQASQDARKEARDTRDESIKLLGGLAKGAKTPEQWNQAVDVAVAMGNTGAEAYRDKFNLREGFMAAAGVKPEDDEFVVVDGIIINKRTQQPVWESPYPKVVSGAGGVHEQPRIGLAGLQGGATPPRGKVIPAPAGGLPQGWNYDDGGAAPDEPPTFP